MLNHLNCKSVGLIHVIATDFNPQHNDFISLSTVGTGHIKLLFLLAEPTALIAGMKFFYFNGLKSVVIKLVEPTVLVVHSFWLLLVKKN